MLRVGGIWAVVAVVLAWASASQGMAQPVAGSRPAAGFPAAALRPPAPLPVDQAIVKAVDELFAQIRSVSGPAEIVIDPLIDGITGAETVATRMINRRVAELAAARNPAVTVLPFTPENVKRARYVFIGTFNPINNRGIVNGPRDAYWICFALIDPATKVVAARAVGRASPANVDSTPTPLFADSPVWALDEATRAYIRACQRSKPGDVVAPEYLTRLEARASVTAAQVAFDAGRYDAAAELFRTAAAAPGAGDGAAALSGMYITAIRDGRSSDALVAFGRLVDIGLEQRRLGVIFLFETGSASFVRDPSVSAIYPAWLQQIADRVKKSGHCLTVVGHASRTGPEPANVRLTRARASAVRDHLLRIETVLTPRVIASGVGSREALVGLPFDDARTAADRRVEFRVRDCAVRPKSI